MGGKYGKLALNPGAQEAFVNGDDEFSAYIGGLGSGKTWAGVARGFKYSYQPRPEGVFHMPFGLIAAATYRLLLDIVIPKIEEIVYITGVANFNNAYSKSNKELTLDNGAKIRLRSLDNPDTIVRGPEYTWFFIDEGRNVSLEAWKLATGRLRQKGYKRGGWVASTPNGFDWMYDVFHPEGALHELEYPEAQWYGAPMRENVHLDEKYISMMESSYSGRFYKQEILGEFVGIVEGGVFTEWDPERYLTHLDFRPELPLYSFWDFGVGDPGICIFAQIEYRQVAPLFPGGDPVKVPYLHILHAIEAKDWTARDWANAYKEALAELFNGVQTRGDYGDPAGMQRNPSTGTSVIQDLNSFGVSLAPAPQKSPDFAIRILQNMMAAGRVYVNKDGAKRVSDAFSSHKWKLDPGGTRVGPKPVHDWTSHFVDAVRYGTAVLLSFHPLEINAEPKEPYAPNTYGYVFEQLLHKDDYEWLGAQERRKPTFYVPEIRER